MTSPAVAPRFYIVTSDAALASRRLFWCHAKSLPASIAVIDDPWSFARIPNGAQCRAYWYWRRTREEATGWESIWSERVAKGGIEWISEEDWERIMLWVDKNRRETMELLHGPDFFAPAPAGETGVMA